MKILKRILLAVVMIIAIILIVALFVKNEYTVEREITINKPNEHVFSYVKYLKNQNKFNTWATRDPHIKQEYKGTDGTVGFISAWESNDKNVGKGEQQIRSIREGESISCDLH